MTDSAATFRELQWLVACATASGADAERLQRVSESLVDLVLDRDDPRRKRSLELAERIERAASAGSTSAQLAQRFGRSPSQIRKLRRQARVTSCALSLVESALATSDKVP